MASLSRGLLHPANPRLFFNPRPILADILAPSRPRFFTSPSLCRLRAATPAAKPTKPASPLSKGLPQGSRQTGPHSPTGYALIKSLASKPTPTVLYEAPSNFWFYFGCWTSGLSILAWTGLTGPKMVFQPDGVPQFVAWTYGVSYVFLGAMGFYLLSKTPNIVGSIRAMPMSVSAPSAARHSKTPQLQLEVTVRRALPFLKPKIVTAPLDKVSLQTRFSLPDEYVPELRREQQKRDEAKRQAELHKHDMDRLLTMPFRRMGRAFVSMFHGVRAAWTDMGYGNMVVDGKNYKVNVVKGFAHDGFRTLERIVPIKGK